MNRDLSRQLMNVLDAAALRARLHDGLAVADLLGFGGFMRRLVHGEGVAGVPQGRETLQRLYHSIILDSAAAISRALDDAGLAHFFLKGVPLFGNVYRPGERDVADIDLALKHAERSAAMATLLRLGFEPLGEREQSGPAVLRSGVMLRQSGAGSELEAVHVDLRWGLEPVERLLPRPQGRYPEWVWSAVERRGALPAPAPAHHSAILIHHLVHHDLLHARGVLDLAFTWPEDGGELSRTAAAIGVRRVTCLLADEFADRLHLPRPKGLPASPRGARARATRGLLCLPRLFAAAAMSDDREHVAITPRRVWRRASLLDVSSLAALISLLPDVVVPPPAFLRWRWPQARSDLGAWVRHVRRTVAHVLP